jgi:hypothetical protein
MDFADLLNKLDKINAATDAYESNSPTRPSGFVPVIRWIGNKLFIFIRLQRLYLIRSWLHEKIGQSAYNSLLESNVPLSVTKPIAETYSKLDVANKEITRLSKVNKGDWITPRNVGFMLLFVLMANLLGAMAGLTGIGNRPRVKTFEQTTASLMPYKNHSSAFNESNDATDRNTNQQVSSKITNKKEVTFDPKNKSIETDFNWATETTSDSELIDLVYTTAASTALSKPIGRGPSPEEFITSIRAAARELRADKFAHTQFLTTLEPSSSMEQSVEGVQLKILYFGKERVVFAEKKNGFGYAFLMCTLRGKTMMNTKAP